MQFAEIKITDAAILHEILDSDVDEEQEQFALCMCWTS